ncbi:hypothetical protein [Streptomyces rimosus]|uniref:hypothetical protein n=1 Tax=Streptomyces rimosus TaxID=1927 RepID=UPI0002ABD0F0|nr:hypothetical protein [Streptomyces rimosus]KEF18257.1 hypothetical protein DF18_23750 [Streptomyces rimosus]KUJ42110.1 hypothetical protein ADK46_04685 [Streptomyces rimosus subsp. rimosus]QDA08783.1 hypothetical protein CTZ40_38560 [Streptomyces rimosus]QEV80061.1 hypothetical protein CP984_38520 [Streptomyces rimosus]QGY66075.1 hypothetical protein V519_009350 [Streptomyces rimosus R6-500]
MAIVFRNATTAGVGSASTGVIHVPSGVANGVMLLLAIALEESGASPAVTGWTQAATVNGGGTQDNATRAWSGSPPREQLATAEQRIGAALDIVEHAPAAWSREADAAWGELMWWARRVETDSVRRSGEWVVGGGGAFTR